MALNTQSVGTGQQPSTGSQPVVIASDQTTFPVNGSGAIIATNTVSSATDLIAPIDVSAYSFISFQGVFTGTATITFRGSNDGTNYRDLSMTGFGSGGPPTTVMLNSNITTVPVMAKFFRAVITSYTNGSITGTVFASQASQSYPGLGAPSRTWNLVATSDLVTAVGGGTSSSTNALSTVVSTALEASHVVKAGSGRLYKLTVNNTKASAQFIQVFNSTTVPADTAVPILSYVVAANANLDINFEAGRFFSTGISVSNSSTSATKTIGSADCWIMAEYL